MFQFYRVKAFREKNILNWNKTTKIDPNSAQIKYKQWNLLLSLVSLVLPTNIH